MARTNAELVAEVIEVNRNIDLDPFIRVASTLVDDIAAAASVSAQRLIDIETWLAAHFYAIRDPRYLVEKAGSVSATIESKVGMGLEVTRYGQMAITLDPTGILRSASRGVVRGKVTWLGTETE